MTYYVSYYSEYGYIHNIGTYHTKADARKIARRILNQEPNSAPLIIKSVGTPKRKKVA